MPQKPIYVPTPTWGNHRPIFEDAKVPVKEYRYYNAKTGGLDFDGAAEDVKRAPQNSIILFHACAHNPTGVDPSIEQWSKLSQICKERDHFILFDLAYQGFASGDPESDAGAVRTFVSDGHRVGLCQSFAKNFGLYGERIGALSFVIKDADEKDRLLSQLKILVRPMYSNPPVYGARLVATILKDKTLNQEWRRDVKLMADRIIGVRQLLVDHLKKAGSKKDWSRITNQIGMFCYSGLTPEQVDTLAQKHHIYLTRNGRISMAGVTTKNVKYLADSMHEVSK
jgi:aspartate aminotransferase